MANVDTIVDAQVNTGATATGWANRSDITARTQKTIPGNDPDGNPIPSAQAFEIVGSIGDLPAVADRVPGWRVMVMQGSGNDFSAVTYVRTNEASPRWLWYGGLSPALAPAQNYDIPTDEWISTSIRRATIIRHQLLLFQIGGETGHNLIPIRAGDLLAAVNTGNARGDPNTQRINIRITTASTTAPQPFLFLRMNGTDNNPTTGSLLQLQAVQADIDAMPLRVYGM